MSYEFNDVELAEIQAARSAGDWQAAYQAVLDAITVTGAGGEIFLEEGVDSSVYLWVQGAKEINSGSGVYADFIYSYNETQYFSRFGEHLSRADIQAASDLVAQNVIDDILGGFALPTLTAIGQFDAAAAVAAIFGDEAAAWAGNPLFVFLGDASFLHNNVISSTEPGYDIVALFAASAGALIASSDWINLGLNVLGAMGGNDIGFTGTAGLMLSVYNELTAQLGSMYGVSVAELLQYHPILGSVYADIGVSGTGEDDIIVGGKGTDQFYGSAGHDIMDGGSSYNLADYSQITNGVQIQIVSDKLVHVTNDGQGGSDKLLLMAGIIGTESIDEVRFSGTDIVSSEIMIDGAGGDNDIIDFSNLSQGITFTGVNVAGSGISLFNFENVVGTMFSDHVQSYRGGMVFGGAGNDTLIGGELDHQLHGEDGNDILIGGAGIDVFDGGVGEDVASYALSATGVEIRGGAGVSGDASGDSFVDIERIQGSNFADRFTGVEGVLETFLGQSGDDYISISDTQDVYYGESGADTFLLDRPALPLLDVSQKIMSHVVDFNLGEGDRIDLSYIADSWGSPQGWTFDQYMQQIYIQQDIEFSKEWSPDQVIIWWGIPDGNGGLTNQATGIIIDNIGWSDVTLSMFVW